MILNDSDAERLLAGQVPTGHSELAPVAAFLSDLPHSYPPAEVGPEREAHLYAMAREARILAAAPPPRPRRSTRRVMVTAIAAALGVLTTGVGVAAAVGANPLGFLPNLLPQPAISARVDTPASLNPDVSDPADRPVPTQPTGQPQAGASTETSATSEGTASAEKSNNGKSDEAKSTHKPTAKPTHTNNGKSGEKSNNGKATAKSTPSNNARTDPPGKSKTGK